MTVRRERFITGCHCALLAGPCYVLAWGLDGDEPLIAPFNNGVGLADVVAAVGGFTASLLGFMALNFFIGAALGESWEMAGD